MIFAVMALFSSTTSAFAAEVNINEASISIAGNEVSPLATNADLKLGENSLGSFTFTGYNGGSYRTIPSLGRRMQIRLKHKAVDNLGVYCLTVSCVKYIDSSNTETVFSRSVYAGSTGELEEFTSGYFSVTPGCDYRLIYTAKNQGGYYEDRRVYIEAFLDIRFI